MRRLSYSPRQSQWSRPLTLMVVLTGAVSCKGEADSSKQGGQAAASVQAPAKAVEEPAEAPPAGCKATGNKPVQLGTIVGDAHGFAGDATHLYFTSWEIYGARGDVGAVRKDGGGLSTLTSLELEPRGLALDDASIYYTSGIRLIAVPKKGGETTTLAPQFSSQDIAVHGAEIFGVPGDYGPYDRLAKIPKKGGESKELVMGDRPTRTDGPTGWSSIAVDETGVYVTDSGNNRVYRFPADGGKGKPLANGQAQPYDLAIAGAHLYFNLATKGHLMMVPKAGGPVKKLASGLVKKARIAGDEKAVYATLSGKTDGAPLTVARIAPDSGEVTPVATVPADQSVDAIALDDKCLYFAQRASAKQTIVYAVAR